jgi:23S rRNA pseudouridine1911/1915/1917 synthase
VTTLHRYPSGITLVACSLLTGRTHQVRVHLRSMGYPLVADALYGGGAHPEFSRPLLHAWTLNLRHPVQGNRIEIVAPPPDVLLNSLPGGSLDGLVPDRLFDEDGQGSSKR